MDWKVVVALAFLGVAIVVALVIAVYTSVSKYAKRLDPAESHPGPPPDTGDSAPLR